MDDNYKRPLLIAIPTNDGINIFPKMLGMAKYFDIYSLTEENKFVFVERRRNPYEKTMQHLKTIDVYNIINDCEIIIAALIGKRGVERLEKRGMKLYFRKGNIQEAMEEILSKR